MKRFICLTQNAIEGMDKKTVERLQPISDVKKPNKNEPKITPIAPMDPIHEISLFEKQNV